VLPDSPAAKAGVQVGDHIVAIGGFPTSKLQNMEQFISRVSGPVDSEVELQLKRTEGKPLFRVRLRRIAPPRRDPFIPPADFSPDQARSQPMV
jgi:C-terminal processing protease CtpA/Prc